MRILLGIVIGMLGMGLAFGMVEYFVDTPSSGDWIIKF